MNDERRDPETVIVETWRANASGVAAQATVLPDGCRDVICRYREGRAPEWFVSPLYDSATQVPMIADAEMFGFRLRPGASIGAEMLGELGVRHPDEFDVARVLEPHVCVERNVARILSRLSEPRSSTRAVAGQVGTTPRTLQRHVLAATGRTPAYWAQLARVRRAARMLCGRQDFADVALAAGFSDQSHLNRAFRRWLGVTPKAFLADDALTQMIQRPGYDGGCTGEQISTKNPLRSVT